MEQISELLEIFTKASKEFLKPVNFVSILIGIVGLYLSFNSWYSDKKKEPLKDYIYKIAEKNLDNDLTEEEIRKKKVRLEEQNNKIIALQKAIEKEIPLEAKKAVLQDKLNQQTLVMKQSYDSVIEIKQELDELGISNDIPKEILNAVKDQISPEYILKERKSEVKTQLTILTTVAAIIPRVLPGIGNLISLLSLFLAISPLFKLIYISLPGDEQNRKDLFKRNSSMLLLLISILFLIIGIIFIVNISSYPGESYFKYLALLFLLLFIFTMFIFRKIVKSILGKFSLSNILILIKLSIKDIGKLL